MNELEQLREQVEAARLKFELQQLGAATELVTHGRQVQQESGRRITEAVGPGSIVDRVEFLFDGVGLSNFGLSGDGRGHIALPSDKSQGDNRPFWTSEQQHREIVGLCRVLSTMSEVGISALENLTNYTIGQGLQQTFVPEHDDDEQAKVWAATCQRIVDNMMQASRLTCEGERESFMDSRVDGDAFIGLRHRGGLNVDADLIDSVAVCEPDDPQSIERYAGLPTGLDWKYGIASEIGRPDRVHGYFVSYAGNENDWDVFRADEMVHVKLNVGRLVKRGLSDFFPVESSLTGGEKLLRNTVSGAAVQAAIAYIREHAPGVTSDTIQDLVGSLTERSYNEPTSTGPVERNIANSKPGKIVDITNGLKYHAGPLGGTNAPNFIPVIQAAWRTAGIRWQMPEYMISGDASNNAYASTLVAEAPFTKATEARQFVYTSSREQLCWKAIGLVARLTGIFGGVPLKEIKRRVGLAVDAPEVAVRNRLEDHQIRMEEHERGLLSLQTWATEVGRDLEEEQRLGAEPRADATAPTQPISESYWRGYP